MISCRTYNRHRLFRWNELLKVALFCWLTTEAKPCFFYHPLSSCAGWNKNNSGALRSQPVQRRWIFCMVELMQPLGGKVEQIKLTINCSNTRELSVPPHRLYADVCWATFSPSKPEGMKGFISTKLVGDRGTRFANWCVLYAKDAWRNRKRSDY